MNIEIQATYLLIIVIIFGAGYFIGKTTVEHSILTARMNELLRLREENRELDKKCSTQQQLVPSITDAEKPIHSQVMKLPSPELIAKRKAATVERAYAGNKMVYHESGRINL